MDGARRRAYLLKDYPIGDRNVGDEIGPAKLSQMTEGELGAHYIHFQHNDLHSAQVHSIEEYYKENVLPPKPLINL